MFSAGDLVVPGGPTTSGFRHEPGVGVKDDFVFLVGEICEDFLFQGSGAGEQLEGLVAVGGGNDEVEVLSCPVL